jgi:hypothetical protein
VIPLTTIAILFVAWCALRAVVGLTRWIVWLIR